VPVCSLSTTPQWLASDPIAVGIEAMGVVAAHPESDMRHVGTVQVGRGRRYADVGVRGIARFAVRRPEPGRRSHHADGPREGEQPQEPTHRAGIIGSAPTILDHTQKAEGKMGRRRIELRTR